MRRLLILLHLFFYFGNLLAQEKPPLTEKDLEKHTYYFEISDNKLIGEGAKFLTYEISKSQYVLLGEYHRSLQISKLTKAIIPIYHDAGCRMFALEIGPVSAEILTALSKDSSKTVENLKTFNSNNYVKTTRYVFSAIPFFSYVEDAEFLGEARKRDWNLIGLDQEFSFGYIPLLQRMYENLNSKKKAELKMLNEQIVALIKSLYDADIKGTGNLYKSIQESKEINQFLTAASEGNPQNQRIAEAIKFTTEVYNYNKIGRYYDNNNSRSVYMKKNLSEKFAKLKFDLKKDKLLLKMGGLHTARGFSLLDIYDFGNLLNELATFYGNQSLHIRFDRRFYLENGQEKDGLDTPKDRPNPGQSLLQMGKRDKWTIIDLRKLRSAVFSQTFNINRAVSQTILGQDLYIIPPTDKEPTPNYVLRN